MSESAAGRFGAVLAKATGRVMEPGHRIELVRNGAVFDALEALIASAEKSLHLSLDAWEPGHASDRMLHAIEGRRRAGVPVRVVVRKAVSRGFASAAQLPLVGMACDVHLFPSGVPTRARPNVVIADGQRALSGGFSIRDAFLGNAQMPGEWRDTDVRVDGPAVRFMQQLFLRDWKRAGGTLPPLDQLPRPVPAGEMVAGFVELWQTTLRVLLHEARARVWITEGLYAPEPEQVDTVLMRTRANLDIRVLASGPHHASFEVREAGRSTYRPLLEGGARIWEFQPTTLNARTAVADEDMCMVGSVACRSREIGAELARDFESDLGRAVEITPETIPAPMRPPGGPVLQRVGEVIRGLRDRFGHSIGSA